MTVSFWRSVSLLPLVMVGAQSAIVQQPTSLITPTAPTESSASAASASPGAFGDAIVVARGRKVALQPAFKL